MKRHEIQVLRKAGQSLAATAESAQVSRTTVKRVSKEPPIESDALPAERPRRGRPSTVERFEAMVAEILKQTPELKTLEILHRLRERGYAGGKSALYGLVKKLRPKPVRPLVRFEGLPGEFSQHDFGQVDVTFASGATERIRFFASRLKYSRFVHVERVKDEKVESVVRPLISAFERFGGVPLVCVFDNPKTIVVSRKRREIEWNKTFAQVAIDYRFAPELCTPRRANQKGSVENLVGFVKGSFFKTRAFHDSQDLDEQLAGWLREVNEIRPCRATNQIPATRLAVERPRLRELPIAPDEYALRFPVFVGPTGRVSFEGRLYSMSARTIGFAATLFLYRDRVKITAGDFVVTHRRLEGEETLSELPEHRAELLAEVSGQRAKLYFKRQRILELGDHAERLLTEIVHRHPRSWAREVEILFDLLETFGETALKAALERAVARRQFAVLFLSHLLERGVG